MREAFLGTLIFIGLTAGISAAYALEKFLTPGLITLSDFDPSYRLDIATLRGTVRSVNSISKTFVFEAIDPFTRDKTIQLQIGYVAGGPQPSTSNRDIPTPGKKITTPEEGLNLRVGMSRSEGRLIAKTMVVAPPNFR